MHYYVGTCNYHCLHTHITNDKNHFQTMLKKLQKSWTQKNIKTHKNKVLESQITKSELWSTLHGDFEPHLWDIIKHVPH